MEKSSASNPVKRELSIRSESIQRIFNFYVNELFVVNRRYQRKLIWTIEEKVAFIDSILKWYPVPLILLAETTYEDKSVFEIIDGMQRLNAITSFIEGEFDYNGQYFDLETMVESKSLLDKGLLTQKKPVLPRQLCELFASYIIPISVYTFTESKKVDEIFIRINSNGKHLSRQELRSAGTLGIFVDIVRDLSSTIRTDVSQKDILNLNKMKEISITNTGLHYGIPVEEIFWVKNNVLTKEMVREARDEEIVADIIAAMAFSEVPPTSSPILDEYYGLIESDRSSDLEKELKKIGIDVLKERFIKVYNEIRKILSLSGKNFQELIFRNPSQRLPRYFQVIFLSLYKLMYRENKEISSYSEIIKKLDEIADHITITAGGNWSATNRIDNINAVSGIIEGCFKERNVADPANTRWLTEFESILMQSKTEQTLYDFKQGFTILDGTFQFDESSFSKIILTLTSMANTSPRSVGYVCIGVSDKKKDADRIKQIYNVESVNYRGFFVTGIMHEVDKMGMDLDSFYRLIIQKIKQQPISNETKDILCGNIRLIDYFDKAVFILRINSSKNPMIYDGKYYTRYGANVEEIKPENFPEFFRKYQL